MKTLLVLLLLAASACSKESADKPAATAVDKDPAAAKKLIAEGAVIVDVRTPAEFEGEPLAQATNIPLDQIPQRIGEVAGGDKSKPVVVYCATGGRAAKAKQQLLAAGYTNVVNGGGYDDLR